MIITHKLQSMDLVHKQNTSRVDVVQDDKYSRDIEFTLTENGVAWKIPDGTTAVVRYKKPDGTGGNYDTLPDGSTAYQISGNVLTVALAPQVCTVQGTVQLSVGLIQGSAEINTFTVNIVVHPNPGTTYQSEDYIKLSGAVPNSGWNPNMYLGTDASGNVVAKEGTSGGGSTSGKDGVGIQSVEQTTTSTADGGTNIVTVTKTDGTSSTFQVKNGSKGSTGQAGTNGKSAYQYAQDGGYTGTESEFAAKLAEEYIPSPAAATVGQTIVVKAVDENGKPTEWEAADMASGSGSGGGIHLIARVVTEANAASIEVTGLSTTSEVLSLRIYNPGSNCGGGLNITVNGVQKINYGGTIEGTSTDKATVRVWLYRDGGTLYGRAIMANTNIIVFNLPEIGEITSITVGSPYNDGTTKYFQTGTIFEIYEGTYPNVN